MVLVADVWLGSFAAGWQASMGGYVAAGSAFAILQSIGMVGAVAIPMSGLGLLGAVLAAPKINERWRWWMEASSLAKFWAKVTGKRSGNVG
jgi:hypothetical protein